MTLRRVLRSWDRFLFRPVSPVPIAAYRILFGVLVLLNGVFILPDVTTFFADDGVLPLADALRYAG